MKLLAILVSVLGFTFNTFYGFAMYCLHKDKKPIGKLELIVALGLILMADIVFITVLYNL